MSACLDDASVVFWQLAVHQGGGDTVKWESYDDEDTARRAFDQHKLSRALFCPEGYVVKCSTAHFDRTGQGVAIILHKKNWTQRKGNDEAFEEKQRHPQQQEGTEESVPRFGQADDSDTADAVEARTDSSAGAVTSEVVERIRSGDLPFVPPERGPITQAGMRAVVPFFNRMLTSRFSAMPFRGESRCYWDIKDHPNVEGYVALTLDDAPCRMGSRNSMVSDVQKLLKEYTAKATFMIVGGFVPGNETELVELLRDGHEFGNHGMLDRAYHLDSREDFDETVRACSEHILRLQRDACVKEEVRWFRAPHAKYTSTMESVLKAHGLCNCMCDTYAFCPVITDGDFIGNLLAKQAQHGSIVLLHMPEKCMRDWCFIGLRRLLDGLTQRGLKAVTVSELLAIANAGREGRQRFKMENVGGSPPEAFDMEANLQEMRLAVGHP